MTALKATDLARADSLAAQVLAASPRSARIHVVKGAVLRAQRRCEEAIAEYETALALDRNLVVALHGLALCKLLTESVDEVIPIEELAIRLSPRDPDIGVWYDMIGTLHLLQSRTDEAIVWFEKARSANPEYSAVHAWLASAYALRGETERAAAELATARGLAVDGRFSSIAHLKAVPGPWWGALKTRALFEATFFAGVRKAGVPEE